MHCIAKTWLGRPPGSWKLRCSITLADDVQDHGFSDIDDGDGSDGDGDDDVDENSSDGDRNIDDDDGDDLPINR